MRVPSLEQLLTHARSSLDGGGVDDHRCHLPATKPAVHHGATAARGGGEERGAIKSGAITDSEAMEQVGEGHGGVARCSAAGAILASDERAILQYIINLQDAAKPKLLMSVY